MLYNILLLFFNNFFLIFSFFLLIYIFTLYLLRKGYEMKPLKIILLTLILLTNFKPIYAATGSSEPTLRGPGLLAYLDPSETFQQRRVLARYPDILRKEGLTDLIPDPEELEKERINERSYVGYALEGATWAASGVWHECTACCSRTRHYRTLGEADRSHHSFIERRSLLEKELIETMSVKRRDAMHKALLEPIFQGGMTISMLLAAKPFLEGNEFAGGIASLWMFGTGLEYGKKLLSALYQIHVSPFADDLYEPMKKWSAIKRYFPPKFQEFVERKFGIGLRNPFNLGPVVDFMRTVVNIPVRGVDVKPLSYAANPKLIILRERLNAYPSAVIEPLMISMLHHAYRSRGEELPDVLNTRPVLYFKGPPGTGKTTVAKFIADALGVPFVRVQFSGPFEGIIGSDSDPGRLLNALTRVGNEAANAVVLLDEAGALLKKDEGSDMGDFLQLFDPGTDEVRMPYLGEPVKFGRFLIIATGNNEIANEALKNRITEVDFAKIDADHKVVTTLSALDKVFEGSEGLRRRRGAAAASVSSARAVTGGIEIIYERSPALPLLSGIYQESRSEIEGILRGVEDPGMRTAQQEIARLMLGKAAVKLGLIEGLTSGRSVDPI